MPVTAMSAPALYGGEFVGDAVAEEPVSELIEQAGRAASLLALREAQLAAVRHGPQRRRAALDLAVTLGVALAFLTAFVLVNWAAASALSGPLPRWAAPLLLAAAWIVIGIGLFVVVLNRSVRVFVWRQRRGSGAAAEQRISARERARDVAWQGMRDRSSDSPDGWKTRPPPWRLSRLQVVWSALASTTSTRSMRSRTIWRGPPREAASSTGSPIPRSSPPATSSASPVPPLKGSATSSCPPDQRRQHGVSRRNISGTDRRSAG
jgi:hypothetical protein